MDWLNYHHLLYFWSVVKEGGVAQAAKALRLSPPTISGQVRVLEEALELKLFDRVGRKLQLTEEGRMVFRYADEIFNLGGELLDRGVERLGLDREAIENGIELSVLSDETHHG